MSIFILEKNQTLVTFLRCHVVSVTLWWCLLMAWLCGHLEMEIMVNWELVLPQQNTILR